MQAQTQTEQLTIVNIIPSGSGFGVTSDGTSVFVPPRVISAANADIGDVFTANLIHNDLNPSGRTPFLAVRLERAVQPQEPQEPQVSSHRDLIIEMLAANGYASSAEIGDALGTDAIGAKDVLKSMWDKGEIAKAMVYANGTQKRASLVMWALNVDDFFGDEIDG